MMSIDPSFRLAFVVLTSLVTETFIRSFWSNSYPCH